MLHRILSNLILLISLTLSSSSSSSMLWKSILRQQNEFPLCNPIEGFECLCSYSRLSCRTNHGFSLPLIISDDEKNKYESIELIISTEDEVQVNDRTFESIKQLLKTEENHLEFIIKFEKFSELRLSSPGLFNNIFPDNLSLYSQKHITFHIINHEIPQNENINLFENLNVDGLEIYSYYPFHSTFQQLFNGSNIKDLRLAGAGIRSDLSQRFTGNIARLELIKQAKSLSIKTFPLYPVHEYIASAFYLTEFNAENQPNYANLLELRIHSQELIPARAFQQYPNIQMLSIKTDKYIDVDALDGLNKLEKLSIMEPNPSLAILNKATTVKEYETNIEKLDEDSQCKLVDKVSNGEIFVRALRNGNECNCMIAYLYIVVGQSLCDIDNCEYSTCSAIRNNYDSSLRAFKMSPSIFRADGTNILDERRINIYTKPYKIPENDRKKYDKAMKQYSLTTDSTQKLSEYEQDETNQHTATKTEQHQDDNRNDDERNRVDQDKDSENEQTNLSPSNELVSSIDQQAEIKSSRKQMNGPVILLLVVFVIIIITTIIIILASFIFNREHADLNRKLRTDYPEVSQNVVRLVIIFLSQHNSAATMVKALHWTRPHEFQGEVTKKDFVLVEEELSEDLKDGEVLCEAVYLSVDPYMRVIKSRNGEFPVGTLVKSYSGWRTHFLSKDGKDLEVIPFDLGSLSPSITLNVLGMPGMTAYFGLRLCEPKPGEVCVVNGAAGAVGAITGQLAKLKGLKVIGFAGTDEKCQWLTKELNFDYAFNYKKISIADALKKSAPNGVDVFFDNNKIKYKETVYDGFKTMPEAFIGLFQGSNTGKAVVKASNYP
ncbi:unnamed protein product [Rotaria sp. Silwood1]|nr:unnamed protein product [Rotaria sp. Silwood1]